MRFAILLIVWVLTGNLASAMDASKSPTSSFVLVQAPKLPEAGLFRSRLENRLNGRIKIDAIETEGQNFFLLRASGGFIRIRLIDTPVPKVLIEDLCESAWHWRTACSATASHGGHIHISVRGTELDKLDVWLLHTDVVASLMDSNAVASYWGTSLHSKETVLKLSESWGRASPPIGLWINFRMSKDLDKGYSFSTNGMEEFGLREIEAKDVNRTIREVFGLLAGMAEYLITKGPLIKDDDTIGDSPELNIRVRQAPSYWREGMMVYRVSFPKD